jgi:hypothetical protein
VPVIRLQRKEVLPNLRWRLIGSPGHAFDWGLSVAPNGDFFLALDTTQGNGQGAYVTLGRLVIREGGIA